MGKNRRDVHFLSSAKCMHAPDDLLCMPFQGEAGGSCAHLLNAKMSAGCDGQSGCAPDCQDSAPEEGTTGSEFRQEPQTLDDWGLESCLAYSSLPDHLVVCRQLGRQLCKLLALGN